MSAKLKPRYRKKNGKKEIIYWQAEFYDPVRRPAQKRLSLKTADEASARRRFAQLVKDYDYGEFDPWRDSIVEEGLPIGEVVSRFLKSKEDLVSVGTYETILRALERTLPPNFPLYGVEAKHVEHYLDLPARRQNPKKKPKPKSENTKAGYAARIRIFFRWAVEEGYVKTNPVPKRARGKKSRRKDLPEFLSEDEYGKLLRAIEADAVLKSEIQGGNQWLLDVIRFAVSTGLRQGEIRHLRWSSIAEEAGMLTVKNSSEFTTKSGRERRVPLVGEALGVVSRLRDERADEADGYVFTGVGGEKLNKDYLSKRFRYYRDLAKLPKSIHFHSLRHTFASWFVLRGGDVYRLKEILGHADIKTTMVYAHLKPEALTKEMAKTFGDGRERELSEVKRLRALLAEKDEEIESLERRLIQYEGGNPNAVDLGDRALVLHDRTQ